MINNYIAGDRVIVLNDSASEFPIGSVATVHISGSAGVYLQVYGSDESIYYTVDEVAPSEFKPNDVVRYIGLSEPNHYLDIDKLYVVNYGKYTEELCIMDDIGAENYLISNNPEMFTLVYRENI